MSGTFNPYSYGAVGDGVNDDGPAFQSAFNALVAAGGGTLDLTDGGDFLIATAIFTDAGVNTFKSLRVLGCGAKSNVICGVGGSGVTMLATANFLQVTVEQVKFTSDGSSRPEFVLLLGSTRNTVLERCMFIDLLGITGLVSQGVAGSQLATVRDCFLNGGNTSAADSGNFYVGPGTTFENVTCIDGTQNGSPAWIFCTTSSISSYPLTVRDSSFDESVTTAIVVKPTGGAHVEVVELTNCNVLEGSGAYEIHDTLALRLVGCRVTTAYVRNTINLFNVRSTRIEQFVTEREPITTSYLAGAESELVADSNCGSIVVIDSDITVTRSAAGSTTFCDAGVRSSYQPGASTPANLLVKVDASNPGQFDVVTTGDAASEVVGVTVAGTAKASSGWLLMPVAGSIPNMTIWSIEGDDHATPFTFQFRNDGNPADPGNYLVDLQGLTTAAQVASAFATAINGQTGANFSLVASVDGAGNIKIDCTVEGSQYNRLFTYGDTTFFGIAGLNGVYGGSSYTKVASLSGQRVTVMSDGASSISAGDAVTRSTVTSGRVAKATSGNVCGRAVTSASASADAPLDIIFSKEAV